MLIAGPRAIPLVVVSYQDNVFVVQTLYANKSEVCVTNKGVICLNPDVVADAVKEVCKKCLQKPRRQKHEY